MIKLRYKWLFLFLSLDIFIIATSLLSQKIIEPMIGYILLLFSQFPGIYISNELGLSSLGRHAEVYGSMGWILFFSGLVYMAIGFLVGLIFEKKKSNSEISSS